MTPTDLVIRGLDNLELAVVWTIEVACIRRMLIFDVPLQQVTHT
jgi:hypothetical protein